MRQKIGENQKGNKQFDIKQMISMVDVIAEEKSLPKETIIEIIEQAIAAAWRREEGDRDMNVRC